MDIVSERSPTSSPPISPIKLTTHEPHYTPSSNFPTWSRASLERAKLVKAIPRDTKDRKIIFESTAVVLSSKCTQTDANSSAYNAEILQYKSSYDNERQKLASLEKKFNFVVVHHEDVMTRLRQEVSELKSENKDLNFRLVMTEGQVSSVQSAYSDEYGRLQCSHCKGPVLNQKSLKTDSNVAQKNATSTKSAKPTDSSDEQGEKQLEQKVLLLKEEITKLKTALKDAKLKNTKLSQLVEYQQQQSQRLHHHSDLELSHRPEPPVVPKAPATDKHRPGNFGHQPLDRMSRIHVQQRPYNNNQQHRIPSVSQQKNDMLSSTEQLNVGTSVSSTNGTFDSEAERAKAIIQLEQLNALQEQELSQLNHIFMEQQRIPNNEFQMRINEKLPPINLDAPQKMDKNFKSPHKKDEIRLPILQPVPPPSSTNRNLTDRQKRAKELHVQRQRNNREFSALL